MGVASCIRTVHNGLRRNGVMVDVDLVSELPHRDNATKQGKYPVPQNGGSGSTERAGERTTDP